MSDIHVDSPVAADLWRFGNVVPGGCDYYQKLATPGEDLRLGARTNLARAQRLDALSVVKARCGESGVCE